MVSSLKGAWFQALKLTCDLLVFKIWFFPKCFNLCTATRRLKGTCRLVEEKALLENMTSALVKLRGDEDADVAAAAAAAAMDFSRVHTAGSGGAGDAEDRKREAAEDELKEAEFRRRSHDGGHGHHTPHHNLASSGSLHDLGGVGKRLLQPIARRLSELDATTRSPRNSYDGGRGGGGGAVQVEVSWPIA
jgi:hypothetical protein